MIGHPRPRVGTAACLAACALLCTPATAPSGGTVQEDGLRLDIELNANGYPDLVAVEIRRVGSDTGVWAHTPPENALAGPSTFSSSVAVPAGAYTVVAIDRACGPTGCGWGTAARLVVRDAAGRCLFDRHVTVSQGPADEQPFDVFDAPAGGRTTGCRTPLKASERRNGALKAGGDFFKNTSKAGDSAAEDWAGVAETGQYSDDFNWNVLVLTFAVLVLILAVALISHLHKVKQRHKEAHQQELNEFHGLVIRAPMLASQAYKKRVESRQRAIETWAADGTLATGGRHLDPTIYNLWKSGPKGGREADLEMETAFQEGMRQPVFFALWDTSWVDMSFDAVPAVEADWSDDSGTNPRRIRFASLAKFAEVYFDKWASIQKDECDHSANVIDSSFLSCVLATICLGDFDVRTRLHKACEDAVKQEPLWADAAGGRGARARCADAVHTVLEEILKTRMNPRRCIGKVYACDADKTCSEKLLKYYLDGLPGLTGSGTPRPDIKYSESRGFGAAVSKKTVADNQDTLKSLGSQDTLTDAQVDRFHDLRDSFDRICAKRARHVKKGLENEGYLNVIKIGYDVDNDGIPDQLSAGNVDAKELHDAVKDAMMTLDMSATDAIEFEKLHILAKTFDLFIYDPGSDHETIKLKDFGMIMHTLGQSIDHETVEAFTARFKRENGGADGMTLPQFITEIFHQLYYMDTDAYLEKIFRIFDRDHSGEITHGELRDELDKIPASHAYARLSEPDIDLLMREADVDHDGTIGIREWVRLMTGEYDEDEEEEASVSSA